MRKNHSFFCLMMLLMISTSTLIGQTGNFDETWKEFLENDKISNMSALIKPNPAYQLPQYAKYLLMNTNTNFCQTKIDNAEELMTEVQAMDPSLLKSIPGYVLKMEELDKKITAYHRIDELWQRFLNSKDVTLKELEEVEYGSALCEKSTLAKYSYMAAYHHLCQGNIARSMDIFENRTLRLTEKTTLRVNDVQGLAGEVAKMKELYQGMARLEDAWKSYVSTGVSPGFKEELPVFECYPMPTIKILILNGALDICNAAPQALAEVKRLQSETGIAPERDVARKIKDLEAAVGSNDAQLAALNTAWEAFIPDNKVKHMGQYGYEYCTKEALIRAYIMDGFAYVCEMSQMMLEKIDAIQQEEMIPLDQITMTKINELADLSDQYEIDGRKIENLWDKFVRQGDLLYEDYESADLYCDNIHQVKDWTMKGLMGSCEDGIAYLEQIESFQRTFEFNFTKDVECRVRKLRIKVWECREEALTKLARIEAPDNYEARLAELMEEYGVGERPEACE